MCNITKLAPAGILTLIALLLGGCAGFHHRTENKTSLVEFLYPERNGYVETVAIPELRLPMRVGVAYTPATFTGVQSFTAREKDMLARQVIAEFEDLSFVDSITLIPSGYLRNGGSFANLEQLQQLFGVDVIVLLSYDQTIVTTQDFAALTYWTIIGAYVVPGEKNDTQTLLDAAVYDIKSRRLLFRAPGTSVVKSRDTLVSNAEKVRENSVAGFELAAQDLISNLGTELENFKTRVQNRPAEYQVSMRNGYSGSGATGAGFLVIGGLLLVLRRRRRVV